MMKYKTLILLLSFLFIFAAVEAAGPGEKGKVEKEEEIWAGAGFVKPKVEFIDVGRFYEKTRQAFTHSFDLTLVMFRGTGWSKKVVLQRLKKVADIFAQCGVRFGRVKFVEAGAPGGVIDFAGPGVGDREIAEKVPLTFRPVLFYFRSIPKFNAYAWPESSEDEEVSDALRNTAWFSLSVAMKLNIKIRRPNYVSEAHELGHILLDSLGHAGAGVENLMAESYEFENDRLTADQCRKIKEHRLVIPIAR
ncbi:MAG: hypothetical protein NT166_25290 [Candidatus Aminicenantes bacterium]|nr:hypothetical protein [Candidatus Aminicenantes bacterium]